MTIGEAGAAALREALPEHALYSTVVTHGYHIHGRELTDCPEYVVGVCALVAGSFRAHEGRDAGGHLSYVERATEAVREPAVREHEGRDAEVAGLAEAHRLAFEAAERGMTFEAVAEIDRTRQRLFARLASTDKPGRTE